MKNTIFALALTVGAVCNADNVTTASDDGPSDLERLSRWIQTHEKSVRPVRHHRTTIVVYFALYPTSIVDLNAKTQELVMNVFINLYWDNELLRWNSSEFGGIDQMTVPSSLIWLPDILLANSADDYREEIDYDMYRVICGSDGFTQWALPSLLKSRCKIDVTFFPFDSQHCHLIFSSWMRYGVSMESFREVKDDLKGYVESSEFTLVTFHEVVEDHMQMVYFIHLRRNPLYYVYTMIIPCLLISTLTLLSFCLPPDSGEKIALGVTVLLAFSVFLMAVGDKLPETSKSVPLIGIYLTIVMGITSMSVVLAVVVIRIDSTATTDKRLPPFLHWLLLNKLRRLLCMNLSRKRRRQSLSDTEFRQPTMLLLRATTANAESGVASPEEQLRAEGAEPSADGDDENEWRRAARVVDRLLCWLFVVATVCVSLTFLVVIPAVARDPAVADPRQLDRLLYGYHGYSG